MSEVVQRRLETLLAELQPRYAAPEREDGDAFPAGPSVAWPAVDGATGPAPAAADAGQVLPQRAVRGGRAVAEAAASRVLEFGREHLAAVVVVLLVGCGWTAYSLFQARSTPVALVAPPIAASTAVAPSPTMSTPQPKVLVHVLGAVREPGIVELVEGSRVQDAIAAAGGLAAGADPGELNLAAVVTDGSQLLIGTRSKPRGEVRAGGPAGPGGAPAQVSLNSATAEQLDTLPGVGPVTAQKILEWREEHGGFNSVSELQEVEGIGPKTYAEIARNVRL